MNSGNDKKGLIGLVVVLSVLVVGLSSYLIYDKLFVAYDENDCIVNNRENNFDNSNNKETKPNEKNTITKTINYNDEPIYFNKYFEEFIDDENNKDNFLNIIVNNIKIGDKNYTFKFLNHPYNGYENQGDEYKGYYNSFYIDDVMIYHQNNQAAYLERIEFVAEINNKYIVVYFTGQGGNRIFIYDNNYNQIKYLSVIGAQINNDEIIYTNYEEGDPLYLINTYKIDTKSALFEKIMIEKGTKSYCNGMTGIGYCNN